MLHEMRWTVEKIRQRLELIEPLVYRKHSPIPEFRFTRLDDPMDEPPIGVDVDDSQWETIEANSYWATSKVDFALRTTFQVPSDWDKKSAVALYLPLGEPRSFSHPEALAYIDGESYATCDRHHQEIQLPKQWRDGQPHLLALHGWTGNSNRDGEYGRLLMRECAVVQIDQPTRDFVAAARVAHGIAKLLDVNNPARDQLLNALDAAFKLLDVREPIGDAFYESVGPAHKALQDGLKKAGAPMDVSISATGHAHIDVAWLWTVDQVRRKSGRTFHTVMRLMEQFPEYHFTQSQPQLYDYVKHDYPELFEEIKKKIADGRWEPIGGMWVEADCNLTGAESLARQFLLGRTFFRDHFGDVDSPVLWLPDVFGYAWALPQLIKEAGLEYFFTIKIGWSQYNRLPYDSFWWQGLDGTRVLTHFSTTKEPDSPYASTYNSMANPQEALGTWMNFQQKAVQNDLLMAFGFGDGGGGPTREMLENIHEMKAFPAAPQMRQRPVGDFFRDLEANSGEKLPTWNGELYLELHRGTYTTQARNKRANRKSEFLLHDAEFVAALASLLDAGYSYPKATFNKAWELVCLNQFHDIIPGSSITPVYVDSLEQYAEVRQMGEEARDAALDVIASKIAGDVLVVNPTSFSRDDLVLYSGTISDGQQLQTADGRDVTTQVVEDGVLIAAGDLAPYSVTSLSLAARTTSPANTGLSASETHLENDFLRVELNGDGDIIRIYDKSNAREVLPPDSIANHLQVFEDRPLNWDAWDIDIFYDDKMWPASPADSVKVVEAGPLRATLEIRRNVLNSPLVQRISLAYNSPRLDFDASIDWQERHVLLKVAFPVDVLTPVATHEIQWGNVERPTHRNTSWDWARFETAAQKWVDLSEGDYGVSLLNDCKYGHDVQGNVMRISLLRAPTYPDPEADRGEHHFAYSLLPHAGRWDETTVAAAYAFNDPLIARAGQGTAGQGAVTNLVTAEQPNIVIETVKRAEDGEGLIVRLYENQRRRGSVTLNTGFDMQAAWQTNLLEENKTQILGESRSITFDVRPYQIVTLRLIPA
ncbi:MAG: alpha-mannosidase [Anaerolineaceae bacterium]|nr:alpha-mannosidase [Anaerolineaceae bacterium]